MIDAIAAEWLKLRTARATYLVLAACLSGMGFTGFVAYSISAYWDREGSGGDVVGTGLAYSAPIGHILLGLIGILCITSEYSTGMIQLSLTAVRRRWTLLVAKAVAVAALAMAAGQTYSFGVYAVAQAVVGDRPIGASLAEPTVLPELIASGLGMSVAAVTGLALGAVLRSTSGALITWLVAVLAPPQVARFVAEPWALWLDSITLPALAQQLAGAPDVGAFGPVTASVALAAYVVVPLGLGVVCLVRRDA